MSTIEVYQGGTDEPVLVETIQSESHDPVPSSVTMRQARLALLSVGLLTRANDMIAALPGEQGEAARIEWDYATTLKRDHPLVLEMGRQLGLDDAAKDDLFRAAALIP